MNRNIAYITLFFFSLCMSKTVRAQTLAPPLMEAGNPFLEEAFTSRNIGSPEIPTRFKLGEDIQLTALGYCHPQSPHFGDPAYRDRLLLLLDHVTSSLKGSGDFSFFPWAAHAYALLKESFPSDISGNRELAYRESFTLAANDRMDERGDIWTEKKVNLVWYNADIRWALGVYLCGVVLEDENMKAFGSAFFDKEFQESMLLGDGGIYYVGYQNETYTYHGENIFSLAWYHLISGDQGIREIIVASAPYYPLSTFNGIGEYYTGASWKHYWNQVGPQSGYIVGALAEDPYNLALAQGAKWGVFAFFYTPDLPPPAPQLPDNYTVYDQNIQGPRGSYGTFGFAGTARVVDNYANAPTPTIGVGKSTLVGAHVLNTGSGFAYNAAIDIVGLEIKTSAGPEVEDRRRKYRFLTTNERSSTTEAKQIHGLTSTYNPSSKVNSNSNPFNPLDWLIHEQWVFMPERVVGHLSVNSLMDNQQAYAVGAIVKMVAGRANWGEKREIVDLGNGHYSYGSIHFIIKEQNLGGDIISEYAPVYSETPSNLSEKSIWYRIIDEKSSGKTEQRHRYDVSDKYYYVIEIFEAGTSPAQSISSQRIDDFHLLTVEDGKRKLHSVMNITNQDQLYEASLISNYSQASLLRSWGTDQPLGNGTVINERLNIPAHHHALIVASSDVNDVEVEEKYYEDVFDIQTICPRGTPCDDGNDLTQNEVYGENCVCESGPEAQIKISLLLEGFYREQSSQMGTELVEKGLLPLSQPFTEAPFDYPGSETGVNMPSNVVEWVLVEIRSASDINEVLTRKAALLTNGGQLIDVNGNSSLSFPGISSGDYYVAIYQRGHLGVISALPTSLGPNATLYDFTTSADRARGTAQLKQVGTVFCLYAGDFDSNGLLNSLDFNAWRQNPATINQYQPTDADGNGVINNLDFNLWKANGSKLGDSIIQK